MNYDVLTIHRNLWWTGLEPIPIMGLFSIFYKFADTVIPEFSAEHFQLFDSKRVIVNVSNNFEKIEKKMNLEL